MTTEYDRKQLGDSLAGIIADYFPDLVVVAQYFAPSWHDCSFNAYFWACGRPFAICNRHVHSEGEIINPADPDFFLNLEYKIGNGKRVKKCV